MLVFRVKDRVRVRVRVRLGIGLGLGFRICITNLGDSTFPADNHSPPHRDKCV